jgi:hypothetical protein
MSARGTEGRHGSAGASRAVWGGVEGHVGAPHVDR